MNINGISPVANTASVYTNSKAQNTKAPKTSTDNNAAVVYKKTAKADNSDLVAKLKADSQKQVENMRSLVEKMFTKQGQTFTNTEDMIKALANGELKVDPETAAQAKEDISEDGYWGVKQTSDRIFDFAKALSGGDSEKMDKMLDAFKDGFKQATKSWGKNLPDLCQQTYDSVLKKFDDYKNSSDAE